MSEKLGQEPAFPIVEELFDGFSQVYKQECTSSGMSKRFYAACAAMQGLLSGMSDHNLDSKCRYRDRIATTSYIIADELIKQENE